jgi:hypothetical protein
MSDNLLSIIAIGVSIAAIGFSILYNRKTLKMTKEHYKKSVEPLLYIWFVSLPNYHKLVLKNGGTGPALIKKVVFTVNNKSYQDMDEVFKDDNIINLGSFDHTRTRIARVDNYALVANGEVPLFEYHYLNQDGNDEFEKLTNKVSLKVDYETIYKESKTFIEDPINKI